MWSVGCIFAELIGCASPPRTCDLPTSMRSLRWYGVLPSTFLTWQAQAALPGEGLHPPAQPHHRRASSESRARNLLLPRLLPAAQESMSSHPAAGDRFSRRRGHRVHRIGEGAAVRRGAEPPPCRICLITRPSPAVSSARPNLLLARCRIGAGSGVVTCRRCRRRYIRTLPYKPRIPEEKMLPNANPMALTLARRIAQHSIAQHSIA